MQLKEAIAELQSQGFNIPSYPEEPQNDFEFPVFFNCSRVFCSVEIT
ncbi:MAG: NADP-dependent isocitrate dehydrogenase [Flavobacterium sp.]